MKKENQEIEAQNTGYYVSPMGLLELKASLKGLLSCKFVEEERGVDERIDAGGEWIDTAKKELERYFLGQLREFTVPLDGRGTEFQQQVWNVIAHIPYGVVRSYTDIARELGNPLVIRAAAAANGKNPLLLFVPCHRVVGKSGEMVGYSGGLWRKRDLLAFENKIANGIQTLF